MNLPLLARKWNYQWRNCSQMFNLQKLEASARYSSRELWKLIFSTEQPHQLNLRSTVHHPYSKSFRFTCKRWGISFSICYFYLSYLCWIYNACSPLFSSVLIILIERIWKKSQGMSTSNQQQLNLQQFRNTQRCSAKFA